MLDLWRSSYSDNLEGGVPYGNRSSTRWRQCREHLTFFPRVCIPLRVVSAPIYVAQLCFRNINKNQVSSESALIFPLRAASTLRGDASKLGLIAPNRTCRELFLESALNLDDDNTASSGMLKSLDNAASEIGGLGEVVTTTRNCQLAYSSIHIGGSRMRTSNGWCGRTEGSSKTIISPEYSAQRLSFVRNASIRKSVCTVGSLSLR